MFKWIKQHLCLKKLWGESENAMRTQIHVAIITNRLIVIFEHSLRLGKPIFEIVRVLGISLLVKDNLRELFEQRQDDMPDDGQLEIIFFLFNIF